MQGLRRRLAATVKEPECASPRLRALFDVRPVKLEVDAEEQARQAHDRRRFGCHTIRWSHSRIQQFQDATSSAAIAQARMLINWNKWRVIYLNTPRATVFDKAVRKHRAVRGVYQRITEYAAQKADEAVKADSAEAVKADSAEAMKADSSEAVKADSEAESQGTPNFQSQVVRNAAGSFARSETPTDGHCLYRSTAEVMVGDQSAWPRMRWKTAECIWLSGFPLRRSG